MRILYIITKSEIGGAQSHVLDLLRHFSREHVVVLATGDAGFLVDEAAQLGVRTVVLEHLTHPISLAKDAKAVREITSLIREFRPDVVHLHSSKAGLLGRLAAWRTGTPAIFTAHGWAFSTGAPLARRALALPAEWLAARLPGHIINVSEWDRALALRYRVGQPTKHHVIHNGVRELATVRQAHANFVVVMVARFDPQKSQHLLIRALPSLPDDVHLKFVGDGPLRSQCEALAAELGVTRRVEFVGKSKDVPGLLRSADVFALTSRYEGFPISILEAMRAGLPVVASRVGGVPEAVEHGEIGFLVDGDVASIVRALHTLHGDAALRERMGAQARTKYLELFTEPVMLGKIAALYDVVAGGAAKIDSPHTLDTGVSVKPVEPRGATCS